LAEEPGAHRRHRQVERLEQRDSPRTGAERFHQLEIPPGHLVDPEVARGAADRGPIEVQQSGRLELSDVAQQCAGRAKCRCVVRADAQAVQPLQLEAPRQLLACQLRIEFPALPLRAQDSVSQSQLPVAGEHHFAGRNPVEGISEGIGGDSFQLEFAGAEIDRRDADRPSVGSGLAAYRGEIVVAASG
jgi:hypothetical protein